MQEKSRKKSGKRLIFAAVFLIVNIVGILVIGRSEIKRINSILSVDAQDTKTQFNEVLNNYRHSFQLFARMMEQEIKNNPAPDDVWNYLKGIDSEMLEIEGDTFDGLYMYYKGRYLYSWDTPYSEYEETGYDATERSWYKAAVEAKGRIVFTPPYMSYANNYILTTISQLQPDGETVFAYDIKMGDIQQLVSFVNQYEDEQVILFDNNGTIIGSTNEKFLGSSLYDSLNEAADKVTKAELELKNADQKDEENINKIKSKVRSASAFQEFREDVEDGLKKVMDRAGTAELIHIDGRRVYGYLLEDENYNFLILAPVGSLLKATMAEWLVPLLIMELLLIYILGTVSREQKNHELKQAYVELGQTQRRLEVALNAAQKAAAVDELTGIMNLKSFKREVIRSMEAMDQDEKGILIMIDGDNFKKINDNYGHNVGDEVIKLTAQMIIGRIRNEDLASRLHGDEYAIFISNTDDYTVAKNIMEDINRSIAKEADKRGIPPITVSAGAVVAKRGDSFAELSKAADEALYKAKETHDGGFAC